MKLWQRVTLKRKRKGIKFGVVLLHSSCSNNKIRNKSNSNNNKQIHQYHHHQHHQSHTWHPWKVFVSLTLFSPNETASFLLTLRRNLKVVAIKYRYIFFSFLKNNKDCLNKYLILSIFSILQRTYSWSCIFLETTGRRPDDR